MKIIPLTQGLEAVVDDEDFTELSKHKWCAARQRHTFYAVRGQVCKKTGKTKGILMHKKIMNIMGVKLFARHLDLDGLNNQKHNLEVFGKALKNT